MESIQFDMIERPRRLRRSEGIRALVQEHDVNIKDWIQPVFLVDGQGRKEEIKTMPGIYRYSLDELYKVAERAVQLGIPGIALFPALDDSLKDPEASESRNPKGLLPKSLRKLKEKFPELLLISDVAMDPYSSDGHDGYVQNGEILNDKTLEILGEMAAIQADAGADIVAPSDMMDGRVAYIRQCLDDSGFDQTAILSYTAKYCSSFYGPFRDALDSAPRGGDKKTYQMNPANAREALREVRLDESEGADILMVKPGMPYLDILSQIKTQTQLPLAVYHVSGEYAMIKMAAQAGCLNEKDAVLESLLSFKRAGADMVFSYYAIQAAEWILESS